MKVKCGLAVAGWIVAAVAGGTIRAQSMVATGVDAGESAPPAALHSREVYPQIVRLSLVEGDVRVAVGEQKGQPEVARGWPRGRICRC